MDKETLLSILGLLTAIAGAIRWLIHVYWKQAETIEDLRHIHEKRTILVMKEAIDDLKKEINMHKISMKTMQDKMEYIHQRLDKSADETQVMIKSVNDMMDLMMQKIRVMESQVVQLAKGMVMIKNKGGTTGG
jgi:hypothetical protein